LLLGGGHNGYAATAPGSAMDIRGKLDVEDLLKIILVLVAIWVVIAIIGELVEAVAGLLGPFRPLLGIIILALIVLYFLDRI
jgi:hypothetical protein